ncbi:DUF1924 domain-containing protein [Roseateles sp. BYS180W]|uniref:DUF1924 domain-containing protein n=1 Tax=Roseateles rivi TaxID=3299028 RepID=A0ABW7FTM9_9BURK
MTALRLLLLALGAGLLAVPASAADTSAAAQRARFEAEAGRPGQVQAGQQFFTQRHGAQWSCASCHGQPPTQQGRHARTDKRLAPLAPAFNPESFTQSSKVDKWFKRNCNDVVSRECSAGEKADVLAYLLSLSR